MRVMSYQKALRVKEIADSLKIIIEDGGELDADEFRLSDAVSGKALIYLDTLEEVELYLLGHEHGVLKK